MKAYVTVPAELLIQAEVLGRREGKTRDEVITAALRNYMRHKGLVALRKDVEPVSAPRRPVLDPRLARIQMETRISEDW